VNHHVILLGLAGFLSLDLMVPHDLLHLPEGSYPNLGLYYPSLLRYYLIANVT
jgi:hypothetical protein